MPGSRLLSFGRDDQLDEAERTAHSGAGEDGRSDGLLELELAVMAAEEEREERA